MTLAIAAAALGMLALGAAYAQGWADRGQREALRQAQLLADRQADAARIAALSAALARVQAERETLAKELEHAALADGGAGRVALPADSVRRIDRR